jgi:hypothetical protein
VITFAIHFQQQSLKLTKIAGSLLNTKSWAEETKGQKEEKSALVHMVTQDQKDQRRKQ